MARTLIVYYSRTGNTKRAALELARKLDADVEELTDRKSRRGLFGYLRSGLEAALDREGDIAPPTRDPAEYDVVVLGTPTWNAAVSSPMRTYLRGHLRGAKALAFFCTCGGTGSARVLRQMTELAGGRQPVAAMVLRERDLSGGNADPKIDRFARAIQTMSGARVESVAPQGTSPMRPRVPASPR